MAPSLGALLAFLLRPVANSLAIEQPPWTLLSSGAASVVSHCCVELKGHITYTYLHMNLHAHTHTHLPICISLHPHDISIKLHDIARHLLAPRPGKVWWQEGKHCSMASLSPMGSQDLQNHCCGLAAGMVVLPSGKHLHNYGKSPFLMGKLTINGHFQ